MMSRAVQPMAQADGVLSECRSPWTFCSSFLMALVAKLLPVSPCLFAQSCSQPLLQLTIRIENDNAVNMHCTAYLASVDLAPVL